MDHTFGEFFDGPSVKRERHVLAAWRRKAIEREFLGSGPSLSDDEPIPLLAEAMRKALQGSSFGALLRRVRAA